VADIVEAMAADRPYRAALGLEVALAEIESQAGTLLDAEVVQTCAGLFRERRLIISDLN
jgi:HD-GYP domain-containing protein (c-di-GMP phosphodiesterase class II)